MFTTSVAMRPFLRGAAVAVIAVVSHQCSSAPVALHSAIKADNPLLWYRLNEVSGNSINYGSFGATHDAVFNGTIARGAGTIGGDSGVEFNSTDDFFESLGASTLTGNPTFSIETLLFLPAGGAAALWGPFLHWGDGGGPDNAPSRTGSEVYFSVQNASSDRIYAGFYNAGPRTANLIPQSQWIHVVWTRVGGNDSASGTTLYVNGQSVALEQDPSLNPGFLTAGAINVNATQFRINRGRDFLPGGRFFTGRMDELALYDRVLSPAEVAEHFAAAGLTLVPGDFDGDGDVDGADFVAWQTNFPKASEATRPQGDADGDGDVDGADFVVWQTNFPYPPSPGAAPVPEPAGWSLCLVCFAGLAKWIRRR
jgi:hypothetical protein